MNTSVRSARTWIDAFKLSTICELMPGWPSTSRSAALRGRGIRFECLEEAVERLLGADAERRRAVAVRLREPGQRDVESLEMFAKLAGVRGALVRCQTLRRVRQHHFVAALDRVGALREALLVPPQATCRWRCPWPAFQRSGSWYSR